MYPARAGSPSDEIRRMSASPPKLKLESLQHHAASEVDGRRPGFLVFVFSAFVLVALLAGDCYVLVQRAKYRDETARLRASMTMLERERADQIVSQEHNKLRLALVLLRLQAKMEKSLHLSISVDSGAMFLEREGALLREMPVAVGQERRVGIAPDTVRLAPPLGVRRVARVMTATDAWEVPGWVYADRGLVVPSDRVVTGALGSAAILLDGGTVIYSVPDSGPLADSTYVLPGAVRARAEDLRALIPNLVPGMRIYFY
jgi:hypothetical protein